MKKFYLAKNERIYQKTFGARSEWLNPILAIVTTKGFQNLFQLFSTSTPNDLMNEKL